jgi:hypothetical protein
MAGHSVGTSSAWLTWNWAPSWSCFWTTKDSKFAGYATYCDGLPGGFDVFGGVLTGLLGSLAGPLESWGVLRSRIQVAVGRERVDSYWLCV